MFKESKMETTKRMVAYKVRIGDILAGQIILEEDRLNYVKVNNKEVVRVNIIANVIDKFEQEGERNYLIFVIDDASGQIRIKAFSDIEKFKDINPGDTVVVIGTLRYFGNEVYINPEIIKKKDPSYLLVRKLELEKDKPLLNKEEIKELREKILNIIKEEEGEEGISIDKIIMNLKENPNLIQEEIQKLLEDGFIYEPRPGILRSL